MQSDSQPIMPHLALFPHSKPQPLVKVNRDRTILYEQVGILDHWEIR